MPAASPPTTDLWVAALLAEPQQVRWLASPLLEDLVAVLAARTLEREDPPPAAVYRGFFAAAGLAQLRALAFARRGDGGDVAVWLDNVLDEPADAARLDAAMARLVAARLARYG